MSKRRVTISDVAELAGVSYQTVSRVINDSPNVSSETRRRVQEVISDTGYRPSHIARSLVSARTATLGLVIPDISNPFFSALARGADQIASENEYSILLANTGEDASREQSLLNLLNERYVDGVIVCGSRLDDTSLFETLSPFEAAVLVNRRLEEEFVPAVVVDDVAGGRLITDHLLQMGHRAIGFVAGPRASYSGQQRLLGYRSSLAAAGIEPMPLWVQHCLPTTDAGEQATRQLLKSCPEITALFCYNDLVALGALRYCASTDRMVPSDISIAGYDDIMLANVVSPALTTCHVPRFEVGRLAASMLLDCIEKRVENCSEILIQPELIVRESTAADAVIDYR
ncbi:MAG: LacI family DNA-binding transcriptional regulator [Candidatus Promineifilaceae bacterium]|nr:LacI family DNA-binding transcriptional regulator [Candidatus Promineifilaceae bacterium]